MVCVFVTTYNHEKFVGQALESILSQRTNFPFEVVVIDDFSTDGTRTILKALAERFSRQLRVVLAPSNENSNRRLAAEFAACTAEFVCIVDGDDYWTSDLKLQRQVDFLNTNRQCSMVFHNALVSDDSGKEEPWPITPVDHPTIATLDSLWGSGHIASCSVMVRRAICTTLPQWYIDSAVSDWALNILAGLHGDVGYIADVMGVYRRHSRGLWTSMTIVRQRTVRVRFYQDLNKALGGAHEASIRPVLDHAFEDLQSLLASCISQGNLSAAVEAGSSLLRLFPKECLTLVVSRIWPAQRPPMYRPYPAVAEKLGTVLSALAKRKVTADIQGHHDSADCAWIAGWVRDRASPRSRLWVAVRSDGQVVKRLKANLFRLDLAAAGIGDGYHAFRCATPACLRDGQPHKIDVVVEGGELPLLGPQFTLLCPREKSIRSA